MYASARNLPVTETKNRGAASPEGAHNPSAGPCGGDEASPPAGLGLRAWPPVQMLQAAAAQGCDVMREADQPAVNSPIG